MMCRSGFCARAPDRLPAVRRQRQRRRGRIRRFAWCQFYRRYLEYDAMVTRRGPNESYARRANAALSDAESAGVSRGLRQILLGLKNPRFDVTSHVSCAPGILEERLEVRVTAA